MGRTHGVHAEPTTFGLKLAGWAFELDRDRGAGRAGARGASRRQALRRRRNVRGDRPRGRAAGVRAARAGAGAVVDADPPARPACGAPCRAGSHRCVAGEVRARDPSPRADRGSRGRGAVRPRSEGLIGDAAQAQPDRRRAHLRAGARRPRRSSRRARERRAVARARHLALVRRAGRRARCLPGARLHARPLRLARRGPGRAARAHAPQSRGEPRALLQPAAAAGARRERPGALRRPTSSSSETPCAPGRRSRTFPTSSVPTPRSPPSSMPLRSTLSSISRPTRATSTSSSTACPPSARKEEPVHA